MERRVLEIASAEAVYPVLAFLVPGLIAFFVRMQFLTGRMPSHTDAVLSYLTLSLIYYSFAFPGVEYFLLPDHSGYTELLLWLGLIFVGPALFGLFLGINAQKQIVRRLLNKIGLYPVHVMPAAWDWKFGTMTEQWVLVVLKDETKFAGLFGRHSFASSDPAERDLYIERIYDIDNANQWHPRDNGVLIAGSEIRTIEFWPYKETPANV